jgi:hypothetical protein
MILYSDPINLSLRIRENHFIGESGAESGAGAIQNGGYWIEHEFRRITELIA